MSIKIGNNFGLANTYSANKTNNLKFGENKVSTQSESTSTNDTCKKIGMVAGGLALAALAVWGGYKFFHKAEKEVAAATAPTTDKLSKLGNSFTVDGKDLVNGPHANLKADNDFGEVTHGITNKIEEEIGITINPAKINADNGKSVKGQLTTDWHITSTDKNFYKIEPDTQKVELKVVGDKSVSDMFVETKLPNDESTKNFTIKNEQVNKGALDLGPKKAKLTKKGNEGTLETNELEINSSSVEVKTDGIDKYGDFVDKAGAGKFVVAEDHSGTYGTIYDSTGIYIPDINNNQAAQAHLREVGNLRAFYDYEKAAQRFNETDPLSFTINI